MKYLVAKIINLVNKPFILAVVYFLNNILIKKTHCLPFMPRKDKWIIGIC